MFHVELGGSVDLDLKKTLKGRVQFESYRDGHLYYKCDNGFIFAVPVSDTGTGTFLASDKAILYMRWLRPAVLAVLGERGGG